MPTVYFAARQYQVSVGYWRDQGCKVPNARATAQLRGGSERMAAALDGRREHGVALAAHVEVGAVVYVTQLLGLKRVLTRWVLPAHVAHPNRVVDVPAAPAHTVRNNMLSIAAKAVTCQTSRGGWWKSKSSLPLPGGSCRTVTRHASAPPQLQCQRHSPVAPNRAG